MMEYTEMFNEILNVLIRRYQTLYKYKKVMSNVILKSVDGRTDGSIKFDPQQTFYILCRQQIRIYESYLQLYTK